VTVTEPVNGHEENGGASSVDVRDGVLAKIASDVRGTFLTVESMAHAFVREAILRGVLQPGERLNQDAIAEALGISRMPVRASLKQLEVEGLVRILPHRGATVSVLDAHEIAEIYDVRVLLETYLIDQAMRKMTPSLISELEDMAARLGKEESRAESFERRKDFYERLYLAADRPRAFALAKQLRASVGRYLLLIQVERPHGHEDLLVHLRNGDKAAAKKWLTSHLRSVSRQLQERASEGVEAPAVRD
jgi:DNA-binding GntR family transcriptional regulator